MNKGSTAMEQQAAVVEVTQEELIQSIIDNLDGCSKRFSPDLFKIYPEISGSMLLCSGVVHCSNSGISPAQLTREFQKNHAAKR